MKAEDRSPDSGLTLRRFAAVLVAVAADMAQIGTTVVTFGGDLVAVPAQVLFSLVVSLVLAVLLGPSWRLLPGFALELFPLLPSNLLPGFTANVLWLIRRGRRSPPSRGVEGRGEPGPRTPDWEEVEPPQLES